MRTLVILRQEAGSGSVERIAVEDARPDNSSLASVAVVSKNFENQKPAVPRAELAV